VYSLSIGDKCGDLAWPLTYLVKVMFSVLVLELITQEQIGVVASLDNKDVAVWLYLISRMR